MSTFDRYRNSRIQPRNQQKPTNRSNIRKPTVTSAKKSDVKPMSRNNQKNNSNDDKKANNTNSAKKDDMTKVELICLFNFVRFFHYSK